MGVAGCLISSPSTFSLRLALALNLKLGGLQQVPVILLSQLPWLTLQAGELRSADL